MWPSTTVHVRPPDQTSPSASTVSSMIASWPDFAALADAIEAAGARQCILRGEPRGERRVGRARRRILELRRRTDPRTHREVVHRIVAAREDAHAHAFGVLRELADRGPVRRSGAQRGFTRPSRPTTSGARLRPAPAAARRAAGRRGQARRRGSSGEAISRTSRVRRAHGDRAFAPGARHAQGQFAGDAVLHEQPVLRLGQAGGQRDVRAADARVARRTGTSLRGEKIRSR